MENNYSTVCPHCGETVYVRNCANCAHFYQHYGVDAETGRFFTVNLGHCVHVRNGTKPAKPGCTHWEEKKE